MGDQVQQVFEKAKSFAKSLGENVTNQLFTMGRVMKAHASGLIRVPWKVATLIPIAFFYFLFPFDLIPDIIPVVGLLGTVTNYVF